jgi:hypothetical protein
VGDGESDENEKQNQRSYHSQRRVGCFSVSRLYGGYFRISLIRHHETPSVTDTSEAVFTITAPQSQPLFRTGNKQTARDRLRETVPVRETRKRMRGFERAPVAKPGDQ